MMVQVVERGTGEGAQIAGVTVAGKTGTAQTGIEGATAARVVHGIRARGGAAVRGGRDRRE